MERTTVKIFSNILDSIGDYNPQLLRELKGQLKPRNIYMVFGLSFFVQTCVYFIFPLGVDLNRRWDIDLFTVLSILGIFVLLVIGTYLLINDLSKEKNSGTLNFIRLSPQPVNSIILGKILGVPSLLYLAGILAFPLHLIAALDARISLTGILVYHIVLFISCGFFYTGAILFTLINAKSGTNLAFLGSVAVLFFLFFTTGIVLNPFGKFHTSFDWFTLFHPGKIIPYITSNFGSYNDVDTGFWYGQAIWNNSWIALGFILLNYAVWIHWIGEGLKRRFPSSKTTLWNKKQGYWIAATGIIILLGFVFQSNQSGKLRGNFIIFQILSLIYFIILIPALTPRLQTLQDWVRYRHQLPENSRSLAKDLLLGEKSPSTLAIAVTLGIFFVCVSFAILLSPVEYSKFKLAIFVGLLFEISQLLLYAVSFQFLVIVKPFKQTTGETTHSRGLLFLALAIIFGFIIISMAIILITSNYIFPAIPAILFFILLGEWIATVLLSIQMSKQLQKLGESATKALLNSKS